MGGHQVPEQGPNDDGYNEEGYDESQRAEILETTRGGPTDGTMQTDLDPDLGDGPDDDDEIADDIEMRDDEIGDDAEDEPVDRDDREEDEIQSDFDNDSVSAEALDSELDDSEATALDR